MRKYGDEQPLWYFVPPRAGTRDRILRSNTVIISALCLLALGLLLVGMLPQLGAGLI